MKKRAHFIPGIYPLLLLFVMFSCAGDDITVTVVDGEKISINNSRIGLSLDKDMFGTVEDVTSGLSLTETGRDELSCPPHYIVVNGEEVTDFKLDFATISRKNIRTHFGAGKRLVLTSEDREVQGGALRKTVTIELYDQHPRAALISVSYQNNGTTAITVDRIISNCYRLDARNVDSYAEPWDFWSFQGSALAWGEDYIFPLSEDFSEENWMGVQPDTKNGGGVPVFDLWTEKTGLGIAHIEPVPKLVYFPIEVQRDGKVKIAMREDVGRRLQPGESVRSLRSAVIVHSLDYFDCLASFSNLLADQGISMKKPSEAAYEPIWCSWGYRSDFTAEDIYQTLPKIEAMGVPWIVIDDRWFDRYGDWNVRTDIWRRGEEDFKAMVDSLHALGYKVKIWWDPPTAQGADKARSFPAIDPGASDLVKNHPEWLIKNEDGTIPKDERGMYMPCPSVPEVRDYFRGLTEKFIGDWDFDGHKLDAYWTVPPCYNPAHNHVHPEESHEDLPKLLQVIYETTKSIKPEAVVEICNCGTAQDFWQAAWIDQPVTSDPVNAVQVRRRIKVFKALMGPRTAAYADHVELTDIRMQENWREIGQDFASAVGTGAVVGTKFTWPTKYEDLDVLLTPEKEAHWMKWIPLYNEMMLSKGEYRNLYDIGFDKPETHLIRKGDRFYYAFYADSWQGDIELRGLESKGYRMRDYVNDIELGEVTGPNPTFSTSFKEYLLIECVPIL